ncbi:MAG: hypothetical protein GXO10_06965 [Crenarchaeota archaeon]|nr:hypothetical protein [Thermoproteota archaeon]
MNILLLYCSESEKDSIKMLERKITEECPNYVVKICKISDIDKIILKDFDHIIAIMPLPVLVRKMCTKLVDKLEDPSITLVSPSLKYVIPICGEHSRLGIDIANIVSSILGCEVVSTCSSPYYSCLEYVIAKLKLIINLDDLNKFRRLFFKKNFKVSIEDCIKVIYMFRKYFEGFDITSSYSDADFIVTLYRDSTHGKPVLFYPIIELHVPNMVEFSSYVIYRASMCYLTVPERFDIVLFSSDVSHLYLRQYFIS